MFHIQYHLHLVSEISTASFSDFVHADTTKEKVRCLSPLRIIWYRLFFYSLHASTYISVDLEPACSVSRPTTAGLHTTSQYLSWLKSTSSKIVMWICSRLDDTSHLLHDIKTAQSSKRHGHPYTRPVKRYWWNVKYVFFGESLFAFLMKPIGFPLFWFSRVGIGDCVEERHAALPWNISQCPDMMLSFFCIFRFDDTALLCFFFLLTG